MKVDYLKNEIIYLLELYIVRVLKSTAFFLYRR